MEIRNIYRRIAVCMWTDQKWCDELTDDGRLAWFMLLSHRRTNRLGVYCGSVRHMAEDWPGSWPVDRMAAAFAELKAAGMIRMDARGRIAWILNFLRYNPPHNPNIVRGWVQDAADIPEGAIRDAVMAEAEAETAALGTAFLKAFRESFPKRTRKGLGNGLPNEQANAPGRVSGTNAEPLPNTGSGSGSGLGSGSGSISRFSAPEEAAPEARSGDESPDIETPATDEQPTEPTTDEDEPKPNRNERIARSSTSGGGSQRERIAVLELVADWNRIRSNRNRVAVERLSDPTLRGLRKALQARTLDQWAALFQLVESHEFLSGRQTGEGFSLFMAIDNADKIENGHFREATAAPVETAAQKRNREQREITDRAIAAAKAAHGL